MVIDYSDEDLKTINDAIELWGEEKQLRVMQEELAECVVAISHYLRQRDNNCVNEMAEEMADVLITLSQHYIRFLDKINLHTINKMKRLQFRIKRLKEVRSAEEKA